MVRVTTQFTTKGMIWHRLPDRRINRVSRLEGGLVKLLPKLLFANATKNDVSMIVEELEVAFFGGALVTV